MSNYVDISPKKLNNKLVGYGIKEDLEAVENSLKNLFTIRKGEVPGKPFLGNPLPIYLFDNIGFFEKKSIKTAMINVVEKYEPRVKIVDIKIEEHKEYNAINIIMDYIVFFENKEIFRKTEFSLSNNMTNLLIRNNY